MRLSVREIPNHHSSLTGAKYSKKNNRLVYFESSLESDFIDLLEFDKHVIEYIEQPRKLILRKGFYHPDFLVKYSDYSKTLHNRKDTYFEVKYRDELNAKRKELHKRYREVTNALNREGYSFEVISEIEIRNEYLENVKFLSRYKTSSVNEILKSEIIKCFSFHENMTPHEILKTFDGSFDENSHIIFILWHLLATGILETNIQEKLNMSSDLWIAKN